MAKRFTLAQAVLKRIELLLRIIAKLLLVTPVLVAMILFNFTVDRSGLFHIDAEEETYIAQAIIDGEALTGYDKMDERKVLSELVRILEEPYDTIALGSSRVLQLRDDAVGSSFLNCGLSNADYRDLMGTFYLFDKADKLPKNLILCIDPGLMFGSDIMLHPYADTSLYDEFLSKALGMGEYEEDAPVDNTARMRALVTPSYLQANIKYLLQEPEEAVKQPEAVTGDLLAQTSNVKLGDGSVLYKLEYRELAGDNKTQQVTEDAWSLQRLQGYTQLSPYLVDLFTRFVEYVQQKGVNVMFLLPPYHPSTYYFAAENPGPVNGFFAIESWLRNDFGPSHNIPVYGTYNPFVGEGYDDEDFYDGLHPKPEVLADIFPGIDTAVQAITSGSTFAAALPQVSYETAEQYVIQRYDETEKEPHKLLPLPGRLRRLEDEKVEGIDSYILGWYDSDEEDATLLARYAVSKDVGLIYRHTDDEGWKIDERFPDA